MLRPRGALIVSALNITISESPATFRPPSAVVSPWWLKRSGGVFSLQRRTSAHYCP
jgi:hypothetical protein